MRHNSLVSFWIWCHSEVYIEDVLTILDLLKIRIRLLQSNYIDIRKKYNYLVLVLHVEQ